jgi:hypothetical protein
MEKFCRVRKRTRDCQTGLLEQAADVLQISHIPERVIGRDKEKAIIHHFFEKV